MTMQQRLRPIMSRRLTDRQAWDWLRDHAAAEPGRVEVGGRTVRVQAGELIASTRGLARQWGWSEKSVRRHLAVLRAQGLIETLAEPLVGTRVSICAAARIGASSQDAGRSASHTPMSMIRASVPDLGALMTWAMRAKAGDTATYHVGNLAVDRARSPVLHDLAEAVTILVEHDYLSAGQLRTRLPMLDGYSYLCTRTGRGVAPYGLLQRRIGPHDWRALEAIRDRQAAESAQRAVRDALSIPERQATDLLAHLRHQGWVAETATGGADITVAGLRVLG